MSSYLGQNFLIDTQIQDDIIRYLITLSRNHQTQSILEIGPGKGALTQHIVEHFSDVVLVEKDVKMLSHLKQFSPPAVVIHQDILKYEKVGSDLDRIIYGSLPYYITSPIIQQFFVQYHHHYGCFIVQKEFGQKITSKSSGKSYLWRLLNYRYDVQYLQTIPATAFDPAPRVQSCIISICTKPALMSDDEFEVLRILIEALGSFKRKTLSKSFKILGGGHHICLGGHNYHLPTDLEKSRLEECSYDDIARMITKS